MSYRATRNIEASFIEAIQTLMNADWSGVSVEKSFSRVYNIALPVICVRVGSTVHNKVEVGSDATMREPQVFIDIFGSDEGNKLDLKDYLVEKLKSGIVYNTYVIHNGTVQTRTASGRIRVLKIDDVPVSFDTEKDKLDVHDRYRTLITLTVSLGKVE